MIQVSTEPVKTQKFSTRSLTKQVKRPKGGRTHSDEGFPREIPVSKSDKVIPATQAEQNHQVELCCSRIAALWEVWSLQERCRHFLHASHKQSCQGGPSVQKGVFILRETLRYCPNNTISKYTQARRCNREVKAHFPPRGLIKTNPTLQQNK